MKIIEAYVQEKSGVFMGIVGYLGAEVFDVVAIDTWLQAFALGIFSAAGGALGKWIFDLLKRKLLKKLCAQKKP